MLKRVLISVVAAVAAVYLGDSVSVWHRMANKTANDPLETMTLQSTIEIPHKDGRDEIVLGQPETQICVHAIFPHDGYNPCWYVVRQNQNPVQMMLLPMLPLAQAISHSFSRSAEKPGREGHRADYSHETN